MKIMGNRDVSHIIYNAETKLKRETQVKSRIRGEVIMGRYKNVRQETRIEVASGEAAGEGTMEAFFSSAFFIHHDVWFELQL